MPAAQQCPPARIEAVRRTRFLGAGPTPAGRRGTIGGLGTDDRYVYATYHCHGTGAPEPGELVVLDQALLADPDADPVVARVPVGSRPTRVAVNPASGKVYVLVPGGTGEHPSAVVVVGRGGGGFAVTARIPVGGGLVDLAGDPAADKVYVSGRSRVRPGAGEPAPGTIHVIDGVTDTRLADRALSVAGPAGLAFDPATRTLYAVLTHRPEPPAAAVAAISCGADGATLAVRTVVPLPARSRPSAAAVLRTAGLHRLYVSGAGPGAGPGAATLTRVELDGTFRSATVPAAGGDPVAVAADVRAQQLHLTTEAGLQVLDAGAGTLSAPLPVGPCPTAVAVDGSGRLHVGDGVDGTLSTVLPVAVTGPVGEHWAGTGGAGGLGPPVTGYRVLPGADPRAGYQVFERGTIFASTGYGAVTLSRSLTAAWARRADRQRLGVPVEPAPDASRTAAFQHGLLVLAPGRAPDAGFAVVGDLYGCFVRPGNRAGLGLPVEDQRAGPDGGLRQRFAHGEIRWHPDTGAVAVHGGTVHGGFEHGCRLGAPTVGWLLWLLGLDGAYDPPRAGAAGGDRATLPDPDALLEAACGFVTLLTGDRDGEGGRGAAAVRQVTDGAGRTLFAPGTAPRPAPGGRPDRAGRIPDLVPVPVGDAESAAPRPLLLFGRGPDTTHTYEVAGSGTYHFGLRAPAFGAVLTSRATAVADLVTLSRLGTADRSVGFAVPPGGTAKDVSLVLDGLPRSARGTRFLVDRLRVAPGQRVAARLRDGGRELLLENSGGPTGCRVRVRPAPDAAPTAPRRLPVAGGKVTRVRPADWSRAGSAPLLVEVRDTVDGPPVTCFQV